MNVNFGVVLDTGGRGAGAGAAIGVDATLISEAESPPNVVAGLNADGSACVAGLLGTLRPIPTTGSAGAGGDAIQAPGCSRRAGAVSVASTPPPVAPEGAPVVFAAPAIAAAAFRLNTRKAIRAAAMATTKAIHFPKIPPGQAACGLGVAMMRV